MEQVFISYSRKDYLDENNQVLPGNIVSRIKDALAKEGISYWFDEEGITHGDAFASIIVKNIRDCQLFLFISSVNSNKSVWTAREIATAFRLEKKIIPFRYDKTPYNDEVLLYLSTLDFIEGYKDPDTAIQRLVKAIKKHLNGINKEKQRKQQELEERKRREEEEKKKAEQLEMLSTQINDLDQKRSELERKLDAARKSEAQFAAELDSVNATLENLKIEREGLLGNNPSKDKPAPPKSIPKKNEETKGNVSTRVWEDIKSHWKSNPLLVNIFAVLAIFALAYLLYNLYGTTLKDYNSLRTMKARRGLSYEYAAMVGCVLASAWGIVKLLRKDIVGYIYLILPPLVLFVAYLFGITSLQLGILYKELFLVCGTLSLLSVAILALRKERTPFYSVLHLNLVETLKDWRYLSVWGSAIILLALFALTLRHFRGVWLLN